MVGGEGFTAFLPRALHTIHTHTLSYQRQWGQGGGGSQPKRREKNYDKIHAVIIIYRQ